MTARAVEWRDGKLIILDQSRLPWEEVFLETIDYREVAKAVQEMKVRGAPSIGVTAAYALAMGAQDITAKTKQEFIKELSLISDVLASTRPTAVNLFQALNRMKTTAASGENVTQLKTALIEEAEAIQAEEEQATWCLSQFGADLIGDGFTILTHCNAGALATTGYGTALGIIRAAHQQGKKVHVLATETRPLLQGARLTTWELMQDGIPITLIADSAAGYIIQSRRVNCIVVGADRIAANGDVANKIGTYTLAVLAMENGIPFYVAAPTSSIDLSLVSGEQIPIEGRASEEVTHVQGISIAPEGVQVMNPAFDITPHYYVTAIVTEKGIIGEPYEMRLKKIGEYS